MNARTKNKINYLFYNIKKLNVHEGDCIVRTSNSTMATMTTIDDEQLRLSCANSAQKIESINKHKQINDQQTEDKSNNRQRLSKKIIAITQNLGTKLKIEEDWRRRGERVRRLQFQINNFTLLSFFSLFSIFCLECSWIRIQILLFYYEPNSHFHL